MLEENKSRLGMMKGRFKTKHERIDKKKKLDTQKKEETIKLGSEKDISAPIENIGEKELTNINEEVGSVQIHWEEEVKMNMKQFRTDSIAVPLNKDLHKEKEVNIDIDDDTISLDEESEVKEESKENLKNESSEKVKEASKMETQVKEESKEEVKNENIIKPPIIKAKDKRDFYLK